MSLCITYPLTTRPVFSPFSLLLDFFHFVSVVLCEISSRTLITPFHSNYIQLTFHSFLMEFPVRKVSDLLEQCLRNFQVVSGDRAVAENACTSVNTINLPLLGFKLVLGTGIAVSQGNKLLQAGNNYTI